jgi:excisionase family DNA binding protein
VRKWITISEAAQIVGVGEKALYTAIKQGRLRAARVGDRRGLRLTEEWLDEWMLSRTNVVAIIGKVER